jgi:hypothetical protein
MPNSAVARLEGERYRAGCEKTQELLFGPWVPIEAARKYKL